MSVVYEYDSGSTTCFWVRVHHMKLRNKTQLSEFLLLGFSEDPALQSITFRLFLSTYVIYAIGNLFIALAIFSESHLHTPMYFFLINLSFSDICFISTTVPKMLVNIQTQKRAISYAGCITQMYIFILFTVLDNFLLAVMAYDHFVAICYPLHYTVIMTSEVCVLLALVCWVISLLHSFLHSLLVLRLSFCRHVEIPHFFCELNHVIQLACSDTFFNDLMMYFTIILLGGGPLAGILYSYSKIISSICAISSASGKYEAFSTCASHLSVVFLFYGTGLGAYLSTSITYSSHSTAVASVMYTVVIPMLDPFIYSLRNADMKKALTRLLVHKL